MKIVGIVLGILLIQLILAGVLANFGPFGFLHTWEFDIRSIEKKYNKSNKNNIIFYGASNFARWTLLDSDLSEYHVENHAFGGSTDKDLVKYAPRILYPYEPKVVFFQTGSNDYVMLKGTDEEKIKKCMEYKKEMYKTFHEALPNAKFVVMSGLLLPGRSEYLNMTIKINEELKALASNCDYLVYVDSNDLSYDGKTFDETIFVKDRIHLNRKGQLLWKDNYIIPALKNLK